MQREGENDEVGEVMEEDYSLLNAFEMLWNLESS